MHIHTTKKNEKIKDIAENYTVNESLISSINGMSSEPTEGEEILVLIPTRSYTVQYGDSADKIALRFGVRQNDLTAMNPHIKVDRLREGEVIALKYAEAPLGMSSANGYCYKDCSDDAFNRAMPFLTYVTFASAFSDRSGIHKIFDDDEKVAKAIKMKKTPLIRVHDRCEERYKNAHDRSTYADELIELATSGGYRGIVLNGCNIECSADDYCSFLIDLRKRMIGCDLILITEVNENSPIEYSEYADASVLYYPKYAMDNPPSFTDGEGRVLADFACRGESAKAFIDLPLLAKNDHGYSTIDEALRIARRQGDPIRQNESTLLSHFNDKEQGECRFMSLKGLYELFKLMHEYDYMGMCFDIMKTPISFLQMYGSLFKTSYFSYVNSRVGCNHEGEG